jgi:hypothetical protein
MEGRDKKYLSMYSNGRNTAIKPNQNNKVLFLVTNHRKMIAKAAPPMMTNVFITYICKCALKGYLK